MLVTEIVRHLISTLLVRLAPERYKQRLAYADFLYWQRKTVEATQLIT